MFILNSSHFRRKNQPKVWSHCCIVKLLMDNVNSCMKHNQNYISVRIVVISIVSLRLRYMYVHMMIIIVPFLCTFK